MTNELTQLQTDALREIRMRSKDDPITGKKVAELIGLKPRKSGKEGADMRAIIHALRIKGYPICATGSGYWWPRSSTELIGYVNALEERALTIMKAVTAMRWDGVAQMHIDVPDKPEAVLEYMVNGRDKCTWYRVKSSQLKEFLTKYPGAQQVNQKQVR